MKYKKIVSSTELVKYRIPPTKSTAKMLLHEFELDLLEQILKFTYIRSGELVDYFTEIRLMAGYYVENELRNRNNASRRLMIMKQAGLIKINRAYDLFGGELRQNALFYSCTKTALELLHETGRLTDNELSYYRVVLNKTTTFKPPTLHSTAIATLGTRLHVQLSRKLSREDFHIGKGSVYPLFKESSTKKGEAIFPDLVLDLPELNKLIVFEVDGGKQSKAVIEDKYFRYRKLMKSDLGIESERELYVIFVPMDDEFIRNERNLKSIRIKHLKNMFPQQEQWGDKLHMFVCRYAAIEDFINKTLGYSELLSDRAITSLVNQWYYSFENALMLSNYEITEVQLHELTNTSWSYSQTPHIAIRLKQKDKKARYYFVLYMNANSVASQQHYKEFIARLSAINDSELNAHHINLLLIYSDVTARETDVLDEVPHLTNVTVVATSESEWRELAVAEKVDVTALPIYEQNLKTLHYVQRINNFKL